MGVAALGVTAALGAAALGVSGALDGESLAGAVVGSLAALMVGAALAAVSLVSVGGGGETIAATIVPPQQRSVSTAALTRAIFTLLSRGRGWICRPATGPAAAGNCAVG
ncbi:hypothetical protein AB0I85_17305 [Micromonospora echinofusca]|uniref:hypothetical protein n=1 Tax=Micromonospora echinofusca TaxID=47858 RepID=UPI0033EB9690